MDLDTCCPDCVSDCVTQILLSWVDVNCGHLVTSASSENLLMWMSAGNQMLQLLNIKFQLNVTLCFGMVAQDEFLHVKL